MHEFVGSITLKIAANKTRLTEVSDVPIQTCSGIMESKIKSKQQTTKNMMLMSIGICKIKKS